MREYKTEARMSRLYSSSECNRSRLGSRCRVNPSLPEITASSNNHENLVEYKGRGVGLMLMLVFPGNRSFGEYRVV